MVRILLWHGWILEGSGSNVYTAKVAEMWRRQGHDVTLVCQEQHPERFPFVDAWATAGAHGLSPAEPTGATPAEGRLLLVRPDIGSMLPVFVYDEYEGFEQVKRFVELTAEELDTYLARNVAALKAIAAETGPPDAVIAGHAVPGPVVARRAFGQGRYLAKIHGSDLEYALREQDRYVELAREGLEGARTVAGATRDVLERTASFVPSVAGRLVTVAPGVEVERFSPLPRREALLGVAARLEADPDTARGRADAVERRARQALAARDAAALDALAGAYDQAVPDPEAARRLRTLAPGEGPLVGYLGKLIPQKGVDHLLAALGLVEPVKGVIVGFGRYRDWLAALTYALDAADPEATRWLAASGNADVELTDTQIAEVAGLGSRVTFTGRLDHRYAPGVLAAMDVLAVPSILAEAFGMVAAEGAAAGALPLVARHSGLAEIADALESSLDRPGLFSYQPGPGATHRLAAGIRTLLALPAEERGELRDAVSAFVRRTWTWERTAERLLSAALA